MHDLCMTSACLLHLLHSSLMSIDEQITNQITSTQATTLALVTLITLALMEFSKV